MTRRIVDNHGAIKIGNELCSADSNLRHICVTTGVSGCQVELKDSTCGEDVKEDSNDPWCKWFSVVSGTGTRNAS
jgi:hypothetical protein